MLEAERRINYIDRNKQATIVDIEQQEQEFDEFRSYLLAAFPEEGHASLEWAFDTARDAHRYNKEGELSLRKSGQLYFGHVLGVVSIFLDEYVEKHPKIKKSAFVTALLLHDTGEDTNVFGDMTQISYKEWKKNARKILIPNIGKEATNIFIALTRPQVNGIDIFSKEQAIQINRKNLECSDKYLLAKSADVLDNARTYQYLDVDKRESKIEEVESYYLPRFIERLPVQISTHLVDQITIAFGELKIQFNNKNNRIKRDNV